MLAVFLLIYRWFIMAFQPFYAAPPSTGHIPSDNVDMDRAFAQAINTNTSDPAPAPENDNDAVQRRLAQLENFAHQQSIQQASTPRSYKEPKINSPAPFKGNKSESEEFILKCQSVFDICHRTYPDDRTQLAFVFNLLQGDAYQWIKPALLSAIKPAYVLTWKDFQLEFLKNFSDSDVKETSRQKLKALKQSGPATSYATDFKKYSMYLSWGDEALRQAFFDGLKLDVQDRLLSPHRFATLQDLVDSAIEWDNLLFQRRRAHNSSSRTSRLNTDQQSSTRPSSFTSSKTVQTSTNGPWPMEVDAAQPRKPLTQAEKDYRKKNDLCMYCGKPGHQVENCRSKPTKSKVSVVQDKKTSENDEPRQ